MAEYVDREKGYPDAISNTLNAFLGSIQKAHHQNLLNEVEFVDTVSKLKNIETKLEAGILTIEQALTLMQSLPAIEYVDEEGFGLDTARILMNMRVSAHTEKKSTTEGDSSLSGSLKVGGIASAFGVSGSLKMSGHLSHSSEHANTSDYSAYTELEVTMKRTKPAPARRLTSQLMQEFIKDIGVLAKTQVALQKQKMQDEIESKEPPKNIPPPDDSKNGDSDGSDESGNASSDSSDDKPDDGGFSQ